MTRNPTVETVNEDTDTVASGSSGSRSHVLPPLESLVLGGTPALPNDIPVRPVDPNVVPPNGIVSSRSGESSFFASPSSNLSSSTGGDMSNVGLLKVHDVNDICGGIIAVRGSNANNGNIFCTRASCATPSHRTKALLQSNHLCIRGTRSGQALCSPSLMLLCWAMGSKQGWLWKGNLLLFGRLGFRIWKLKVDPPWALPQACRLQVI